jgi:hypothetical protein
MATHATVWSGLLSSAESSIAVGTLVVLDGDTYKIATTANRTSYGRSVGMALTAADSTARSFELQVAGHVPAATSGLGAGAETWVICSATGTFERDATPDSGEDVVGKCNAAGDVTLSFGVWDSTNVSPGGGAASEGAATAVNVSDGSGGWNEATSVKAGAGYIALGANPAEDGAVRLSSNTFVTSEGDGAEYELIGLVNDVDGDRIEIGNDAGIPVRISAGALDEVRFVGQEIVFEALAWVLGDDVDVDPQIAVGAGAPADAKPDGSLYQRTDGDASTGLYTRQDGAWEAVGAATATDVVNVMDYYEVADGGASYNLGGVAVTTKNVANAFQAAYEDKIVTGQAFTLWLPPASDYGVTAYSWKEALTWDVSEAGDNIAGFEIVGSGVASIIIPDSSAGLNEKLYIAGAGPDCLSMLFAYRRMFWVGDEDATSDCVSVLRTSVDMDVLIDECQFYSIQTSSATSGVVYLDTMGAIMRRTYFHGCTADNNGAVVYVGSGCFGATFEHVQWYPWEKGTNPFGGTHYDKGTLEARYHVIIAGGGTLQTASRVTFDNCTWAESGVYAAVKCDPGANLIDTVHFKNCTLYGNLQRMVECVANTRHVIVDGCSLSHNGAGVPTIDMQSSTCERLTIRGTEFSHSGLEIHADNSQLLVEVFSSEGGTYKVDGAAVFTVDAATTWHGLTSATAAPAARRPVTDITKNDATDLTLTATQYAYPRLNITGTPGGAFNVIAPNAADTEFMVINQTASACTIKKSGGTGITIAANKAAKVWHNGTDYIRLTADA